METKGLDVVYFVKDTPTNEELRYSIRSVVQNMPYRKIWIFGGHPNMITPDIHVRAKQVGATKWDNVREMFRLACENKELTDNFILFNDDFFIMKPTTKIEPMYRSSLEEHISIIENAQWKKPTAYTKLLRSADKVLADMGKTRHSYELHVPFIFNKKKLLKLINDYPEQHCTRTFYGNLYNIGGKQHRDVKIFSDKPSFDYKESQFLSTDDSVIHVNNNAWRYIRKQFPKHVYYEE